MNIEKAVLSVITTNKQKIDGGAPIFICETKEEMENVAANLEAIIDGIAHRLGDELYVIVKH